MDIPAINHDNNDCALRAVVAVTGEPYKNVFAMYAVLGRRKGSGSYRHWTYSVLRDLGFETRNVNREFKAKTIRTLEREMDGALGAYLVNTRRHILAIVDGHVHDWTKGRQHRVLEVREVYRVGKAKRQLLKNYLQDLKAKKRKEEKRKRGRKRLKKKVKRAKRKLGLVTAMPVAETWVYVMNNNFINKWTDAEIAAFMKKNFPHSTAYTEKYVRTHRRLFNQGKIPKQKFVPDVKLEQYT